MTILQLAACRRQTEQMEQEAEHLSLNVAEKNRLKAMLKTAKEALDNAERLLKSELGDGKESVAKLQLWERKLLDLSLRNNLLNMRYGKNAIPFMCDDIAVLEDELEQGREFVLEQKELKAMYRAVRNNLEETGANTLFLTLGTLKWQEQTGSRAYEAPILLLPVEIVPLKKDRYALRKRDEEVILNITLMEFLKQNYGITVENLQPLPRDTYGIDVNFVLHELREAIGQHAGWEVKEESVVGIFSFTKFIMWNDIHTHSDDILSNDLIRSLVEGRLVLKESTERAEAAQMDRNVRPDDMAIPMDTDSSQLEAIAESQRGESFILYGPPGTGKSQTITNLIANAVYHGMRVLFVAEKKAALDVVQSRLSKIGIAPFCLELHSNKVDKQHFLQQMQSAIDAAGTTGNEEYRRVADELYAQRMQLKAYMDALHRKQAYGCSLYDCINRSLSTDAQPMQLSADFIKEVTAERIDELCNRIDEMDVCKTVIGIPLHEHPLHGLMPKPQQAAKSASYVSTYQQGDTLEKQMSLLPQILEGVRQQIERGKKMSYFNKTHRQCLEADYKWKKFSAWADVDEALLDNIDDFIEAAERWNAHIDMLPQWKQCMAVFTDLKSEGLSEAVEMYRAGVSTKDIQEAFLAGVYRQLALYTIGNEAALSQFSSLRFGQMIEKYRELTHRFQLLTRQELQARLAARIPVASRDAQLSSELTLLRKRISNKGRGTSIRGMIDQMPTLLPVLCPVILMSPLSVAQYIDIDAPKFDLVVFDEASQMPTSEAVGAIARSKAAIVVGDPKQMPPTSFFSVASTDDEEADVDDLSSILDDCISLSMPARYLSWHYRSKHESLIAFSNMNYYDGQLITFPSVDDKVRHVTWQNVDGFYDYGKTRTNKAEAEAVVAEAIQRMRNCPQQSIGIVAFSKQQSDLIEDILNEAIAEQPDLEDINKSLAEPLFVKNLENVQGDERDVILFSVGYGPDKDGHVSMNFGPLNKVGGERRLNVAVSRARYEMKVFSTLKPEQIDERRTQASGVLGLKQFLKFANQGSGILDGNTSGEECRNLMVCQIKEALSKQGIDSVANIGTSAFRIDLAIVDPEDTDRYLLGLLCDSNNGKHLKTTRDREVLCPSVLHLLGWNLMNVWSVDWFLHSEAVIKNIVEQIKESSYAKRTNI